MFGRKKKLDAPSAKSSISRGWDLHAHLLPAVDDGVRSIDESFEAIRALKALGYTGCVITPHIYKDLYNNTRDTLESAFDGFCRAVEHERLDFGLHLAAEYFGDEHLLKLADSSDLLTFPTSEGRCVLIEFPYIGEPLYWADTLAAITRRGYRPVIAHPERYRYVAADIDLWLSRFSNYRVSFQCDLGSLVGQYGREAARAARTFLNRRLAIFWGTDLHRPSQVDRFIRPAIDELGRMAEINFAALSDQS